MNTLLFEVKENIGIITFNRPERYNAINEQMLEEVIATIERVGNDHSIRGLILTGAGDKAFCCGADFGKGEPGQKMKFANSDDAQIFQDGYRSWVPKVVIGLQNLRVPTIAALNGYAVGMGCDTALACDIRIACENTKVASIWIKRGFLPAESGFYLLPRLVGLGRAAELILSGRFVEAEEGERIGLYNRIVPAAALLTESIGMAQAFAKNPAGALKLAKMVMYRGLDMDLLAGLELAGACQSILATSEDVKEAMNAWREKREPIFKGR
ncbi:MAG TPA: enoyl-CoA hydratase-related protein [Syntrophales bacterium]|nr:enoyl-CoA hydratase-related protein [Syntrophales bacterium]